jgi:RNA polymerase sigma-70 factor (ECF subfamily)
MEKTLDTELAALRPKVLSLTARFFRASRMEGDPEDIVQDVMLRLWKALREGQAIRNPEAWAVTATKNACVSALRKSHNNKLYPLFESLPDSSGASRRMEEAETNVRFNKILEQLPVKTRQLLKLRASGMSLDEIAAATGRPKGSIKSSISAARKELMKTL